MEEFKTADFLVQVALLFNIVGGLCAIGIAFGYPTARWLGNRVGQFLSGWNDEKFEVPPPRLAMATSLAARGDLEGALAFYEELLEDYPQEEEIHYRMLEIALGPCDRPELAEQILQRGLLALEPARGRALLRVHDDLRNGRYRPMSHLREAGDTRGMRAPGAVLLSVPPIR